MPIFLGIFFSNSMVSDQMSKRQKTGSLLDDIKAVPAASRSVPKNWAERMKATDPEAYAEIHEVMVNWVEGGVAKRKFPTIQSLHLYLSGKDPERPIEPKVEVGVQGFRSHIHALEAGSRNLG